MIKARLSIRLESDSKWCEKGLEVSAETMEILQELILRTTLIPFAKTVKAALATPEWKEDVPVKEPVKPAEKPKKEKK